MKEESDEILVGKHESGVLLEEGMNTGLRNYCAKCKRNVHCHVKVEKDKAEIVMTCSNDDCECRCRTHFACKRCGRLHPYGKQCTQVDEDDKPRDPKSEEEFQKLLESFKENKK